MTTLGWFSWGKLQGENRIYVSLAGQIAFEQVKRKGSSPADRSKKEEKQDQSVGYLAIKSRESRRSLRKSVKGKELGKIFGGQIMDILDFQTKRFRPKSDGKVLKSLHIETE